MSRRREPYGRSRLQVVVHSTTSVQMTANLGVQQVTRRRASETHVVLSNARSDKENVTANHQLRPKAPTTRSTTTWDQILRDIPPNAGQRRRSFRSTATSYFGDLGASSTTLAIPSIFIDGATPSHDCTEIEDYHDDDDVFLETSRRSSTASCASVGSVRRFVTPDCSRGRWAGSQSLLTFTIGSEGGGSTSTRRTVSCVRDNLEGHFGRVSPIPMNNLTKHTTILLPSSIAKVGSMQCAKPAKKRKKKYETAILSGSVTIYMNHIVNYLLQFDTIFLNSIPKIDSRAIDENARVDVVDWLLKVQVCRRIPSGTYLKAVKTFDCVLFNLSVARNMYQLVAITCLWIMNKFDSGTKYLHKDSILTLLSGAFTEQQLISMEMKILKFINYSCSKIVDATFFAEVLLAHMAINNEHVHLATYFILEVSTLSKYYSTFTPSKLAGSAVFLAMQKITKNTHLWNKTWAMFYNKETISYIATHLYLICKQGVHGCFLKYCKAEYGCVVNYFMDVDYI